MGLIPLLWGCRGPVVDVLPGTGVCVWNQAYQERSAAEADSIEAMLEAARGCYTLLDPFDVDTQVQVRAAIPELQSLGNEVGCYISVGTCEEWRADYASMAPYCTDREWNAWPGEFFVSDTDGITPLMEARFEDAAAMGCDWVEFDNMDWGFDDELREATGFEATAAAAIAYTNSLCESAHALGMKCMGKSSLQGAVGFDGGTFESWPNEMDWWEHADLQDLLDAGKTGIVIHYAERNCESAANSYRESYGSGLSFLCEDRSLGAYRRL